VLARSRALSTGTTVGGIQRSDVKTALIIGASRGLGLGLVEEHLARGWSVTATVRTGSAELEALAARASGRLAIERVDITSRPDVADLAHRLAGRRFDLVFLNAGIMAGRGVPLADVPDEELVGIFMTNAVSPIRVADALIGCVAPNGTVAFMSSILGSIATNEDGRAELYRASKAALNSLIRSFCARHRDVAFTCLAVHPGVVRTSMGGPTAPLDIATSVKGVADMLEKRAGTGGHAFVDYRDQVIPW
jgi:NAD(P)-dependent dehydrogenase (short-subunit alcohol dehydrogenase family)